MKTAISIPDDVFRKAERLAKRLKKSRSQLYTEAVRKYIAALDGESITKRLNAVYGKAGASNIDPFIKRAARNVFRNVEW